MTKMEPTPEQLIRWTQDACLVSASKGEACHCVARIAYAAGADAELEACVEWIDAENAWAQGAAKLRAARRPKPPSLKQKALRDLDGMVDYIRITQGFEPAYPTTIKDALEALPDD